MSVKLDEAVINRVGELARKELILNNCIDAMKWFCGRVDNGEVRSTRSYNRFKELISEYENGGFRK